MNNTKKLFTLLGDDKNLLAIFTGIVLCGLAFIGLAVTAGIFYF